MFTHTFLNSFYLSMSSLHQWWLVYVSMLVPFITIFTHALGCILFVNLATFVLIVKSDNWLTVNRTYNIPSSLTTFVTTSVLLAEYQMLGSSANRTVWSNLQCAIHTLTYSPGDCLLSSSKSSWNTMAICISGSHYMGIRWPQFFSPMTHVMKTRLNEFFTFSFSSKRIHII